MHFLFPTLFRVLTHAVLDKMFGNGIVTAMLGTISLSLLLTVVLYYNVICFSLRMNLCIVQRVARRSFAALLLPRDVSASMPKVCVTVHPEGLHPIEAVKAYYKHTEDDMSIDAIVKEGAFFNMKGDNAGRHAVYNSILRVAAMECGDLLPETKYKNCGRKKSLTEDQEAEIVTFVKKWRHKVFCTCHHIRNELRLSVTPRTINRVLNFAGYYWKVVPRIHGLTTEQLKQRKEFVDAHVHHPSSWWVSRFNMVLDGLTLTMPPKTTSGKQKHAAQRISQLWVCDGERLDNDIHTFNRYGIQLGTKVALWGGFTGNGSFTLRMWTPKPKMTADEWAALVPTVRSAIDDAYGDDVPSTPWVLNDNERFLQCPDVYRRHGLSLHRFPPSSGDLNPIETVWAWLRKDLAHREQTDLKTNYTLTPQQFKQRCAQLLNSYCVPVEGEIYSRIQKLIRGMPKRLRKCKDNKYGCCGK